MSYFSDEGRSYTRSEASKHSGGFEEYIKDSIVAKEKTKLIAQERIVKDKIDELLDTLKGELNAIKINTIIQLGVGKIVEENLTFLEEKQRRKLKLKLIKQTAEEFRRRRGKGYLRIKDPPLLDSVKDLEDEMRMRKGELPTEYRQPFNENFLQSSGNSAKVKIIKNRNKNIVNVGGWSKLNPNSYVLRLERSSGKPNFITVDRKLNFTGNLSKQLLKLMIEQRTEGAGF